METVSLFPGVTLRCVRDTRFKQGCLSVQMVEKMTAETAPENALLPSVLLRGSRGCPDLRAITARLDELYGGAVSPICRRVGDCQTTGLFLGFMDDRFALPGDRVLEPTVDFLRELLLEPVTEEGFFRRDYVESEKRNTVSAILADRNDKRVYAMLRLLKILCREDSFGIPRLGEPEQVEKITPGSLYRRYQALLKTAPVEIFYVGSGEPGYVADLLRPVFDLPDRRPGKIPPQTGFRACPGENVTETMDVTQGKLCMGFTTPITLRDPRYPAMQVLSTLYGGGMTSKLFRTVREEQSLCYSIGASFYGTKGLLTVSAGIDTDQEARTREEILRQLELCRRGEISDAELNCAKEALISSYRAVPDSPGAIENYFSSAALGGCPETLEEAMEGIRGVTADQTAEAAETVTLHSTYFLKGASA